MTTRRPRRRARAVALAALGMLATSTLLPGSAHAQTDSDEAATLGGYEGRAHASGLHLFYNPEGLLPVAAIVDVGAPDALATISSGPASFARAAVLDPGDLLVNPDTLLAQLDPSYPAGTLPAYPFRIEANSTVGSPTDESRPAPGLDAQVEATDAGSTSRSRFAAIDAPGILHLGSVDTDATTTTDGSTVQVHARTVIGGFDLLGLLQIESITTDVVARSDGGDTEVEGGTVIGGATFLGQPVTIDEHGVHADPAASRPGGSLLDPLLGPVRDLLAGEVTDLLAELGIRVTLPGPIVQDGETAGMFASTGLRIEVELSERTAPIIGQIADLIPGFDNPIPGLPGLEDLLVVLRATHIASLEVGRAQVSLTARPGYVAPPFDAPAPSPPPPVAPPPPSPAPALSPPVARKAAPPPAPVPAPATDGGVAPTPAASTEVPAASLGAGIGALALLALLAQPFFGDRLSRAAAAVLATGPTDTCPLEER